MNWFSVHLANRSLALELRGYEVTHCQLVIVIIYYIFSWYWLQNIHALRIDWFVFDHHNEITLTVVLLFLSWLFLSMLMWWQSVNKLRCVTVWVIFTCLLPPQLWKLKSCYERRKVLMKLSNKVVYKAICNLFF